MSKSIGAAIVLLLIIGGGYWYWSMSQKQTTMADYKNIAYTIEGQPVQLVDGKAETEAAPGSASKITTTYFGNNAKGDLNGDGIPDLAFLLTQNQGGSGTFYYVVAALQGIDSYAGTSGVLLGDRIAPQTTEIRDGQLIVNYADRKPGEPMTAQPSVGVSKYLKVSGAQLVEAPQSKVAAGKTDLGTYAYECDEHVTFTLTPADEMATVTIKPKDNPAYPPQSVLLPVATPAGKTGHWFSDNKTLVLSGEGEGVTLTAKGSEPLNCSPVPDANNAPWNWGD